MTCLFDRNNGTASSPACVLQLTGPLQLAPHLIQDSRGESSAVSLTKTSVGIGVSGHPRARLHVNDSPTDSNGGTIILGDTSSSNLRLGVHSDYSWIQSHGLRPLHINSLGNATIFNLAGGDVGIGVSDPNAKLHVAGSVRASRLTLTDLESARPDTEAYLVVANESGDLFVDKRSHCELVERLRRMEERFVALEQEIRHLRSAVAEISK